MIIQAATMQSEPTLPFSGNEVEFNLNCQVRVKLTPYGFAVFMKYYDALGLQWEDYYKYRQKDDGWFETELWELMHIFGPTMYMGNTHIPFENNKVMLVCM